DQAVFTKEFAVTGVCAGEVENVKDAEITVAQGQLGDLSAGQEVTVRADIENTGEETTTYTMGVEGNELFSTTLSVVPATLTLEPGETGNVDVTLKLNDDAAGLKSFYINAIFDSSKVRSGRLDLTLTSGTGITGASITETLRENWFIWAIVLVNIILIIAIIAVAVRMSRA
ncbi:MAG: putative S-layer protein, partial [Nanoarchaeota archaeon]